MLVWHLEDIKTAQLKQSRQCCGALSLLQSVCWSFCSTNGITLRKFLRNRVWQRPSGVQPNNYAPRRIVNPVRTCFHNLAPSLKGRRQECPSKKDIIRCGIHSGEGMTEDLWPHKDFKFYFYLTYSEQWAKSVAKCLLCHQKATRLSLVEELHLHICNSYGVMKASSLGPLPNSLP